jgi:peptide chain release factor 2
MEQPTAANFILKIFAAEKIPPLLIRFETALLCDKIITMIDIDQIKAERGGLQDQLLEYSKALGVSVLSAHLKELKEKSEQQDFWEDHEKASALLKEKKAVESKIESYETLKAELEDLEVMLELADEDPEGELAEEALSAYTKFLKDIDTLRIASLLDGPHDGSNAIVTVHSGAGGTDAQDWAEMLLRMYLRWAESRNYKVRLWEMQSADEAGIKSATFTVEGENAYGYLKTEKGIHRLVRISPFNSQGKRQTSFASVDVMPEIEDEASVDIEDSDLRIDTYRSSGAGGQHVNKTDSAVRITHLPTNIVVTCQNERSQHQNREVAMRILKSKLLELAEQEHKDNLAELAGDYSQIAWGNQIRSYVFHPYSMVKDHRTEAENGNVQAVMDGEIDYFINEKLKQREVIT